MTRRIAIVGAGPSGLFAAQALIARDESAVEIDIYDRLPAPYGLLRYGVAPDHTSIKNVAIALARTFESGAVTFRGLVEFGKDVTRDELLAAYDAVIYAVGASEDLHMGVPGEDLAGSRSAREFVAWYSGHPDADPQYLDGVSSAVAVGVGNVAVDVARILAKDPADLTGTDMPIGVLEELHRTRVRDVWVIGRRGPQHASFTTVELRELLHTPGVAIDIDEASLEGIDEETLDRRTKANVRLLREAATADQPADARCTLHFRFWRRPAELIGTERVEQLSLERTEIAPDGRVRGTGEVMIIDAELVLRAIGYRSVALPGVPFDPDRGVVSNLEGRVTDLDGTIHPREYVVGWIKRGPIGVIGTNKSDANQTVTHLLADLAALPERASEQPSSPAPADVLAEVLAGRGIRASSFADWQRIDAAEQNLGAAHERPRTKIEAWHELLELCRTT